MQTMQTMQTRAREPDKEALFGRMRSLVDEGRGILSIIRSIKIPSRPSEPKFAKLGDDPLYKTAIRRLRTDGIMLASMAEAWSLLFGPEERDETLGRLGCSWDESRKRVDLGGQKEKDKP